LWRLPVLDPEVIVQNFCVERICQARVLDIIAERTGQMAQFVRKIKSIEFGRVQAGSHIPILCTLTISTVKVGVNTLKKYPKLIVTVWLALFAVEYLLGSSVCVGRHWKHLVGRFRQGSDSTSS